MTLSYSDTRLVLSYIRSAVQCGPHLISSWTVVSVAVAVTHMTSNSRQPSDRRGNIHTKPDKLKHVNITVLYQTTATVLSYLQQSSISLSLNILVCLLGHSFILPTRAYSAIMSHVSSLIISTTAQTELKSFQNSLAESNYSSHTTRGNYANSLGVSCNSCQN